jgi:hypothetical protein
MNEFKNIEKLNTWLKANMKYPYNLPAVLSDLEAQYSANGMTSYELRGYETKSGNPETYSYSVAETHDEDNDTWDTVFEF